MPHNDLIDRAVAIAEAETGVRGGVSSIPVILVNPSKCKRFSDEEKMFVKENAKHMTASVMSRILHRHEGSVEKLRDRLYEEPATKSEECMTPEEVAMGVGVYPQTIIYLIDRGLMPSRKVVSIKNARLVYKEVLLRWLVNPENWIYFETSRVGEKNEDKFSKKYFKRHGNVFNERFDHAFWEEARRLVRRARAQWKDEWLTTPQAANLACVSIGEKVPNIFWAIKKGNVRAKRWKQWWVLKSSLPKKEFAINATGEILPRSEAVKNLQYARNVKVKQ